MGLPAPSALKVTSTDGMAGPKWSNNILKLPLQASGRKMTAMPEKSTLYLFISSLT